MVNLNVVEPQELKPRITVFGVGGAGGNAVNNMIRSELLGVEFVVANTDAQALALSEAEHRIQLGREVTQGLGAGSKPEVGMSAAEESMAQIESYLDGIHMCFITAGMGGGTGTGAAPVIAKAAKERNILTVAVVTKPFLFEGRKRMKAADMGLEKLAAVVDILVVIPNQNLFRVANAQTSLLEAFKLADDVLHAGVRSITDLMIMPGLINLDFNDVRTVMEGMGKAVMGTGMAEGEGRARKAAEAAVSNPLLDDVSLMGAKGVLINITGGPDLSLMEVEEAAEFIRNEVDEDAEIILGSTHDEALLGVMRVAVVATGLGDEVPAKAVTTPPASPISQTNIPQQTTTTGQMASASLSAAKNQEAEAMMTTSTAVSSHQEPVPAAQSPITPSVQEEQVITAADMDQDDTVHQVNLDQMKHHGEEQIAGAASTQASAPQATTELMSARLAREHQAAGRERSGMQQTTRPHPLAERYGRAAPEMPTTQRMDEGTELPRTSVTGEMGRLIGGIFGLRKTLTSQTAPKTGSTEPPSDGGGSESVTRKEPPRARTSRVSRQEDNPDQLEIPAFLRRRDE
ncbi:MAG: cell division protein FtsZ [Alphaproteobacteria bacterium]|jgi:cell division protein FtsZ|nr:cell division protein FtsZ [Alphaproteobacteria bacterium]